MTIENALSTLFPQAQKLVVRSSHWEGDKVQLILKSTQPKSSCPTCGQPSQRVHSYYTRKVTDLPLVDKGLMLVLEVRRFRCHNQHCKQCTFAEQFGDFLTRYSRVTGRLKKVLERVGLIVGGNPGALLLKVLGLAISPDKLLRVVHALPMQPMVCPKEVGVDEFALKRGIDYGSVIVNLETGQPVDLLPSRDTETVSQWLKQQPHIEVIARDRSKEFAFAATQALPHAQQVLDRWHVLKNLRETLERELNQFQQTLKQTLGINGKVPRSRNDKTKQEASLFKRRELFARIRSLNEKGNAISQIARSVGVSRATVHQAIRADALPEARQNRQRTTSLDAYHSYLAERFSEGCTVAKRLWRELQQQGYTGSYAPVRRWVYMQKHYANQVVESKAIQATPKQLAYWFLRDEASLDESEKINLQRILESLPALKQLRDFALTFKQALIQKKPEALDTWGEQIKASSFTFFQAFVQGLSLEWEALKAACTLPWSNGPTEGVVNRIKLVKRQMYGRGSFELLRKRVLLTTT